jgi:hypothetical protein
MGAAKGFTESVSLSMEKIALPPGSKMAKLAAKPWRTKPGSFLKAQQSMNSSTNCNENTKSER